MTDHNYLFVGVSCMLFSFGIVAKAYAKFNISYEQGFVAAINEANFKNFKYANINIHHQHNNPYKTISKLERLNRLS